MNAILGGIAAILAVGLVVQTARLNTEQAEHEASIAKHAKAVADHNAAVSDLKARQADDSAELAALHSRTGEAAAAETRADTTDRIQRIRYVSRTVPPAPTGFAAPAAPVAVPDSVRDILAEAVDAANAASRGLRARPDGRRAAHAGDDGPVRVVGVGRPGPGPARGGAEAAGGRARLPAGPS